MWGRTATTTQSNFDVEHPLMYTLKIPFIIYRERMKNLKSNIPRLKKITKSKPPNFNSMHFLTLIPFFFFFFSISLADPRITKAGIYCGNSSSSSKRFSITSFLEELQSLAKHIKCKDKWSSHLFSLDPNTYALAQCMDDLTEEECNLCFKKIRDELQQCFPADFARIYLDGCFLRYDNYSFFKEAISQKYDKVVCNLPVSQAAREEYLGIEFAEKVHEAITNVTVTALSNNQFAVAEVKGGAFDVYALTQCWESVSEAGCESCLKKASEELRQCLPGKEGRALNTGCYLRYSTKKFYNDVPNNDAGKVLVVVLIAVVAIAISLLALLGTCVGYSRMSKKKGHENVIHLSSAITNSSLCFKYEVLKKATNSFSSDRKLGEGGSGSVYKGNLADGRTVAVKRLCFNTRQWVDDFFNEVNLVSGIQHKNLIKLLGCSIEGPESLLVYEYLSNASLNQILFDRKKSQILSWQQRLGIITGVAEGLAHLHGGVPVRIIHRDIKCSNILLDKNLTPKIADFGLVRGFSYDKTHLSTGIAGTLGYVAPEYLVRGQLTEKADVYSFGVLVIETISGRKNNAFIDDSILHTVWNHYQSNSLQECVDSRLKQDFPMEEASKVLQVGLLCTQASVTLRPSMPEVIQMLTNYDYDIPEPKQPPFLTSSVMSSDARVSHTHICITNISTDSNPTFYSISTTASFWNTDAQASEKRY